MANPCAYPGCDKAVGTGTTYCGRSHAAKHQWDKRKRISSPNTALDNFTNKLEGTIGSEAARFIGNEIVQLLDEGQKTNGKSLSFPAFSPPMERVTYPDVTLSLGSDKDVRPTDRLDFDIIEMMLRSGPVIFVMEMKRAPVARVFSPGHYTLNSPDKELAEVATAACDRILPKMANDFSWSAFGYGASFQEKTWTWKTKYQLGMSDNRNATTAFLVPNVPASVAPYSIDYIRRNPDNYEFNGFVQKPHAKIGGEPIKVSQEAALILPLNGRFGDLHGESFLKPLYPTWLWYEVILRAMARYMERMAIPVAVGRAPSRGTVEVEGKSTPQRAMDLVLAVAGNIAKSNAAALPSDRDESGNFLWDLTWLTSEARSQLFIEVLEYLQQEMVRGGLSADRSLTQSSGGVGSKNIGEVHAAASSLTSELIMIQFVYYLNRYFLPDFSLWNRGPDGPPIWMTTQPIDSSERDLLMRIVNIMGNSTISQEFFRRIDIRSLAETTNIPLLSEEEVEEERERLFELGLKHQEQQQKMMQRTGAPGTLQAKKGEPEKSPEPAQSSDNGETIKQEYVLELISSGQRIPLFLSNDDLVQLGEK